MSSDEPSENHEVGYGKPPQHSKWRKGGPSPNPEGRPPRTPPDAESVVAILDGQIPVRKGDGSKKMHAFEASVRMLLSQAVNKHDVRAAAEFLKLCDKYGVIAPSRSPQGNLLLVPYDWDWHEWLAMFKRHGPPPWPGERSGLQRDAAQRH